jgi:hypothetical protein
MPSPNDLASAYEYFIRQRLCADLTLVSLVGKNTLSLAPNVYFQAAEDGAGDLVVIFDYAELSEVHRDAYNELLLADATFLVKAVSTKARAGDLRRVNARISAALSNQEGETPDGTIVKVTEERSGALPSFEEDGVLYSQRGGYYNLWVEPLSD